MITIAALQEYRKCHEKLVDCVAVTKMPTKYGKFRAYGYVNRLNGEHHVALVKGRNRGTEKMYSAVYIPSASPEIPFGSAVRLWTAVCRCHDTD